MIAASFAPSRAIVAATKTIATRHASEIPRNNVRVGK
jgi:hypothetical protein